MQVVFALAKAGHHQHIPEICERLRHERGYIPGNYAHTASLFAPFVVFPDTMQCRSTEELVCVFVFVLHFSLLLLQATFLEHILVSNKRHMICILYCIELE